MGGNVSLVAKDNSYGIAFYESYRNRNPYDRDGDGFSELGKLNMNTFGFRAITVLRISAASIWNTIPLTNFVAEQQIRFAAARDGTSPSRPSIIINSGGVEL